MVLCRSYMHEFSVCKDMKKDNKKNNNIKKGKEVAVGKVAAHLCLTQMMKVLKIMLNMIGW